MPEKRDFRPWISMLCCNVLDTDPVRCMRCGRLLDQSEMDSIRRANTPPCCDMCYSEVIAERALNRSMWPSDWYAHAWQDCEGRWHVEIQR